MGRGNWRYKKGASFEYEWMYYCLYHHFDNVRSYASKGVADVRSIPPKWARNSIALYAQCKNTLKEDYIAPDERDALRECSEKFHCLIVEPFKKNRKCFVKIEPWKLDGKIMTPEKFLKKYYGIEADTWKTWRENWFRKNIKRKRL
jgi:hypothetical protein